ncbi:MAG: hypothetical protein WCQ21_35730, partial [Verrucomicrobiota bacterium]
MPHPQTHPLAPHTQKALKPPTTRAKPQRRAKRHLLDHLGDKVMKVFPVTTGIHWLSTRIEVALLSHWVALGSFPILLIGC